MKWLRLWITSLYIFILHLNQTRLNLHTHTHVSYTQYFSHLPRHGLCVILCQRRTDPAAHVYPFIKSVVSRLDACRPLFDRKQLFGSLPIDRGRGIITAVTLRVRVLCLWSGTLRHTFGIQKPCYRSFLYLHFFAFDESAKRQLRTR